MNKSDRGGERWNEGVRKRFENERGRFEGESTRTGNIDFDEDVSVTIFGHTEGWTTQHFLDGKSDMSLVARIAKETLTVS